MSSLVRITKKTDPELFKLYKEYLRLKKELGRAANESHYAAVAEERADSRCKAANANFWDAFEMSYGKQDPEHTYVISTEKGTASILVEAIPEQKDDDDEED